MLRWMGSVLILAGCFGLGILFREQMNGRIRALRQLADILELFESEIRYGRSALPECCRRVGEQIKGDFGAALRAAAGRAEENAGDSFPEIFREEMGRILERLPLKQEDREYFLQFVSSTGFMDGQMQQRAIAQSVERLEKTRERLEQENAEKGRIAVGLGAMSGLLLILVLW